MSSITIGSKIKNIKSMQDDLVSIYNQLSGVKISSTFRGKYLYDSYRLIYGKTFTTMASDNVSMIEEHVEKMNTIKRNALEEINNKIKQYNTQLQSLNYEYEMALAKEQAVQMKKKEGKLL